MEDFERAYLEWLKIISEKNVQFQNLKDANNKLIELLSIGRVERTPSNKLRYQLEDSWQGIELINGNENGNKWSFFPDPIKSNDPTNGNDPTKSNDPTNGFINYGPWDDLINVDEENKIKIEVESDGYEGVRPRRSIRIFTEKKYNGGLFIIDLDHIPEGKSTWPAFWMFGPNWPNNGEIDIIEGVNSTPSQNNRNHSVLHTRNGCFQDIPDILNRDCNADNAHTGCGIIGPEDSFGHGFNKDGGGVYACEWIYDQTIKIWFWKRSVIPVNVSEDSPEPNTWGEPYVTFNPCPEYFKDMEMVINTTLCGDWAGNVFPGKLGECERYVKDKNNNSEFKEAYFLIRSIKVFQLE